MDDDEGVLLMFLLLSFDSLSELLLSFFFPILPLLLL